MNVVSTSTASPAPRGGARRILGGLLTVLALASPALSQPVAPPRRQPVPPPELLAPPPADGAPRPAPASPTTEEFLASLAIEPPPGVLWQVDDDGREYFVTAVPKESFVYTRIDEHTLRSRWGMPVVLAGEDEESFLVKTFKVTDRPAGGPPPPTAEELAKAAETYVPKIGSADTLRLVPFDAGLPKEGALWRNGFDVADMNGDGQLDILHGPPRKSFRGPVVYLGDGKGGWHGWDQAVWPSLAWEYGDAAAADFNGDGKMDAAFGLHLRGVVAMLGDGQGKFSLWNEGMGLEGKVRSDPPAFSSREIDVADWNRDGRPDLVVYSEGPRGFERVGQQNSSGKIVYLNRGDGSWDLLRQERPSPLYGDALVVADFNLDGRLDFATSTNVRGQRMLLNLGTETGAWEGSPIAELRPFAWIWTVATADFDSDGRPDLAVSYLGRELGVRRAGVDVLLARADGSWGRVPILVDESKDLRDVRALATGDLDGDRAVDLVATTRFGETLLFRGDGKGGFAREEEAQLETRQEGCQGWGLVLRDLDGDRRDEILASFSGEACSKLGWLEVWKSVAKTGA